MGLGDPLCDGQILLLVDARVQPEPVRVRAEQAGLEEEREHRAGVHAAAEVRGEGDPRVREQGAGAPAPDVEVLLERRLVLERLELGGALEGEDAAADHHDGADRQESDLVERGLEDGQLHGQRLAEGERTEPAEPGRERHALGAQVLHQPAVGGAERPIVAAAVKEETAQTAGVRAHLETAAEEPARPACDHVAAVLAGADGAAGARAIRSHARGPVHVVRADEGVSLELLFGSHATREDEHVSLLGCGSDFQKSSQHLCAGTERGSAGRPRDA